MVVKGGLVTRGESILDCITISDRGMSGEEITSLSLNEGHPWDLLSALNSSKVRPLGAVYNSLPVTES